MWNLEILEAMRDIYLLLYNYYQYCYFSNLVNQLWPVIKSSPNLNFFSLMNFNENLDLVDFVA